MENETWLPTLITDTPEAGYKLAITLARRAIREIQPDTTVLKSLRKDYAFMSDTLLKSSEIVAIHFQTVAAANNYWREAKQ